MKSTHLIVGALVAAVAGLLLYAFVKKYSQPQKPPPAANLPPAQRRSSSPVVNTIDDLLGITKNAADAYNAIFGAKKNMVGSA